MKDPIEIECDSSKDGLGAVLLQNGHVIAYASRLLTETEKRTLYRELTFQVTVSKEK